MYHSYLKIALFVFTHTALAAPWFTGPLLAPAGATIPVGHFNFEPYSFYTTYPMGYKNIEATPVLSIGLTNFLDLQTALPIDYSWDHGQHSRGVGDYGLALGVQALRQQAQSWKPDLRIVVQEVFPTGKFDNLNPKKLATDQTGLGSYQTYVALNFQKLIALQNEQHYLRARLSVVSTMFGDINVHGLNVFGGITATHGLIKLKNSYSTDLAFEYTLTQQWVAVAELLYVHSPKSNFQGNPGFTPDGTTVQLGGNATESVSLAPALEYNFTANLGVIGGFWFSVTGPHRAQFKSSVIAVNYFY